jgi:hypothetical protein
MARDKKKVLYQLYTPLVIFCEINILNILVAGPWACSVARDNRGGLCPMGTMMPWGGEGARFIGMYYVGI